MVNQPLCIEIPWKSVQYVEKFYTTWLIEGRSIQDDMDGVSVTAF